MKKILLSLSFVWYFWYYGSNGPMIVSPFMSSDTCITIASSMRHVSPCWEVSNSYTSRIIK